MRAQAAMNCYSDLIGLRYPMWGAACRQSRPANAAADVTGRRTSAAVDPASPLGDCRAGSGLRPPERDPGAESAPANQTMAAGTDALCRAHLQVRRREVAPAGTRVTSTFRQASIAIAATSLAVAP